MGLLSISRMPGWVKKALLFILLIAVLSPFFGIMADRVGYSEPLENVAEKHEAEEKTVYEGLLPDYTVPGLNINIGTLLSAIVGTFIVFGVVLLWVKVVRA